jgi:hypothetical protein
MNADTRAAQTMRRKVATVPSTGGTCAIKRVARRGPTCDRRIGGFSGCGQPSSVATRCAPSVSPGPQLTWITSCPIAAMPASSGTNATGKVCAPRATVARPYARRSSPGEGRAGPRPVANRLIWRQAIPCAMHRHIADRDYGSCPVRRPRAVSFAASSGGFSRGGSCPDRRVTHRENLRGCLKRSFIMEACGACGLVPFFETTG